MKKKSHFAVSESISLLCLVSVLLTGCGSYPETQNGSALSQETILPSLSVEPIVKPEETADLIPEPPDRIPDIIENSFSFEEVPPYNGHPYVNINEGNPYFSEEELSGGACEYYSPLDAMGRCGTAFARVGTSLMPTEERGSIGMVKPTGWHTIKYDCVNGRYLYNRCHLIGYQLTGENANVSNLITGTRYLNIEGMLPFENMVADYVRESGKLAAYRVTPIYQGNELLARGVLMEGKSIEDDGCGICFCVFAYNVQPGILIDYSTGDSTLAAGIGDVPAAPTIEPNQQPEDSEQKGSSGTDSAYIININTGKFHYPDCSSVQDMKEKNKRKFVGTREELLEQGFSPCGRCMGNP